MLTKLLTKAKNNKGFTLIELIVVIAILGILAAILIPQFTGFQDKARSSQALVDAKNVATAIEGWIAEGKTLAEIDTDIALGATSKIKQISGVTGSITFDATGNNAAHPGFSYSITPAGSTKTYTCDRSTDGKGTFTTSWS